jgi:hypothetical protein
MSWLKWSAFPILLVACTGTEDTDETGDTDAIVAAFAVTGDWAEVSGSFPTREVWGYHSVSDAAWSDAFGSTYAIAQYSNEPAFAIAQNDAVNSFNPSLWSRFDAATDEDGGWFYCQTVYDAASEDDALNATPADDADPETSGCGGFSWSHLVPKLPIAGNWDDGFAAHGIDEATWVIGDDSFAIYDTDLGNELLIAQNGADNTYNPGLWSRFEWQFDGSALSYCQSVYDGASAEAATAAPRADAADLTEGCGGFPWSTLGAPID